MKQSQSDFLNLSISFCRSLSFFKSLQKAKNKTLCRSVSVSRYIYDFESIGIFDSFDFLCPIQWAKS